ncbi:MAG: acyl-CoA/acyl-ACP dehydrogenase [Kangiellaceae bacterium]|nr:acyl-CoA/acyl-ACP dehydrogenase [Kangiellaceae bacterium]
MDQFQTTITKVTQISEEIAHVHADDVDKQARFPEETIQALKRAKILSVGVPKELGGEGLNVKQQGEIVRIISRYCSSSAMILGMHFIKVASIVHFRQEDPFFNDYLESLVKEQRLVGSVTSEEGVGGNLRNSLASVHSDEDRFELVKQSTCLSYGAYADDLLITCRRENSDVASDQVLLLATRNDLTLTQKGEWDSMGMRGTCSPPFEVKVNAMKCQIFKSSFATIASQRMVPDTHILWAHVWLGIADAAAKKARILVQKKFKPESNTLPAGAEQLAELDIRLERFKDTVESVSDRYIKAHDDHQIDLIESIPFSIKINALKLNSSQLAAEICQRAMAVCGFAGYLNNSPYSIARHLRDALSAAPMIGNGRLVEANATHLLAIKG